jgi:hypothetical protein
MVASRYVETTLWSLPARIKTLIVTNTAAHAIHAARFAHWALVLNVLGEENDRSRAKVCASNSTSSLGIHPALPVVAVIAARRPPHGAQSAT